MSTQRGSGCAAIRSRIAANCVTVARVIGFAQRDVQDYRVRLAIRESAADHANQRRYRGPSAVRRRFGRLSRNGGGHWHHYRIGHCYRFSLETGIARGVVVCRR